MIRQTYRNLGLSLTVDGSENAELKIRDIPNIEVGDWRLIQEKVEPDDSTGIDEPTGEMMGGQSINADANETVDTGEVEYDLMEEDDHSENDLSGNDNSKDDIDQNDDHGEV